MIIFCRFGVMSQLMFFYHVQTIPTNVSPLRRRAKSSASNYCLLSIHIWHDLSKLSVCSQHIENDVEYSVCTDDGRTQSYYFLYGIWNAKLITTTLGIQ